MELYHFPLSTCSQKVRLVLAEKGQGFESREVNLLAGGQHDPDYVKLNPGHVVPTLVHDGRVYVESTLINEYLEEAFPEPRLRPESAAARHAMRLWTKRFDDKFHPACGMVTFAVGTRPMLLAQPEAQREAAYEQIPDPQRRAVRRSVVENGVKAPEFAGAVATYLQLLDDAERALADGPWLLGDDFSLVDACALPYVLRLDHLAMAALWEDGARPGLASWFDRIRARPSYAEAVAKWTPEPVVANFRKNGAAVWADVEPLTR